MGHRIGPCGVATNAPYDPVKQNARAQKVVVCVCRGGGEVLGWFAMVEKRLRAHSRGHLAVGDQSDNVSVGMAFYSLIGPYTRFMDDT